MRISLLLAACGLSLLPLRAADELPKPTAHETRNIEGWTVLVDHRLLETTDEALGKRSLMLLQGHLQRINDVVAPDRLEKLHAVTM